MPPTLVLLKNGKKKVYGNFLFGLTFTRERLNLGMKSNKYSMTDCKINLGFKIKSMLYPLIYKLETDLSGS